MKKNELTDADLWKKGISKLLLIMRLTFVLSVISIWAVTASGYSQAKLSLDLKNATLKEVFSKIESQTSLSFLYKSDVVNPNERVTIQAEEASVHDILKTLFSTRKIQFEILDNSLIVLLPETEMKQQLKVTGVVTDASTSEPIVGANIIIEGTTMGTVTDVEGRFALDVKNSEAVLVISILGYLTEKVTVNESTNLEIKLASDVKKLEEVVVIGYGSRQKKDLTGAVSQISSSEITQQTTMTPQLAMQGKMAGVLVTNPGSNPNARPSIRIRGVTTLGFNEPLYVIDGIPLTEGGEASGNSRTQDQRGNVNVLNMINPNDIESISVLKDASATAIYGVRASNGVILITTKRGAEGKAKVNFTANYGIQNVNKKYEVANVADYVAWTKEAWANNPSLTPNADHLKLFTPENPNYLGDSQDYTEDWRKAALVKNATIQDYNLGISGGNKMSNYALGAGYAAQENPLWYSSFSRYSFFLNSDHKLNKFFKVGESFRFMNSKTKDIGGGGLNTVFSAPWQPLYDPNGMDGYALPGRTIDGKFLANGYGGGTRSVFPTNENYSYEIRNLLRTMGSFYAEFSPFQGLRFKGTFSFDYYTNTSERMQTDERGLFEANRGLRYPQGTTYRRRLNENINLVKEFLVAYTKSFGNHNIDVILNAMDQQVQWNLSQNSIDNGSSITSWDQRRIDEGWAAIDKNLLYERNPSGLQGYMGRLSYNFNRKYYLDATIRRDGTSKFGPGYKWGTFPSFGAAWRISSEKFMENIPWLSDLKIRGGWGKTGNQETKDYAFLSVVNYNPKYATGAGALPGDGIVNAAAALGDFPISDMSWETVISSSIGFDAVLLNNKLNLTAEYYSRTTDGILQTIDIPRVIGALNNPVVNLAKVDNKGMEFQVGYNNNIGDFVYNASFNLTTVKNTVKKVYLNKPTGGNYNRIEVGYPMNYLYGYKTAGIFQTEDEVAAWKATTSDPGKDSQKKPGDIIFVDVNGAPTVDDPAGTYVHVGADGKIDGFDQVYLGKTIPGYYYGLNLGGEFKGFDFNLTFRGIGDVQKIYTDDKQSIGAGGGNFLTVYRNRWTVDNPSNTIPRAINGDPSGNNRIADRHVEDAGFFRFQNFQIGYNFKSSVLSKVGLSSMRCYFSGSNLFVVTPYSDLDPEENTTPMVFTVGANLNF
jgi:TonB-linked SusC/RagA family outer membrane protein